MGGLLIIAGGTGGHVFPALAVAQKLRINDIPVFWLGTRKGLEAQVAVTHRIPIEWIDIRGLRGKGLFNGSMIPFYLLRAVVQSMRILQRINPLCVLGMGGFVSAPGVIAAKLLGKPIIIHEQNALAGWTNRCLSRYATRVLTGFSNVANLPRHSEWVGNPVRVDIDADNNDTGRNSSNDMRILVVGGSQGAQSFNQQLPQLFARLESPPSIWHQSGEKHYVSVRDRYALLGLNARVSPFIENMADAYRWADVLVCRSGAMTVSEICAAGKASILVPYPYAAGDHQRINAEVLVQAGAAQIVNDGALGSPLMEDLLVKITKNHPLRCAMALAARSLHKPHAADSVAAICKEYLHA